MNGKILIANNLADGVIQYVDIDGNLTSLLREAAVATTPNAEEALLAFGRAAEAANTVTGAELIAVTIEQGAPVPVHIRERIRVAGPTIAYAA